MSDKSAYYISPNGVVSVDTSELLADVQATWKNALGDNLSVEPSTPQGRMIEIQTAERKLALTLAQLVAGQINPNYATGQFLDADASIFGVERFGASSTVVYGEISGIPQTLIAPGFRAKTTAGDVFETRQEVVIDNSGSVAGVPFYSVETGPVPCAAETLTNIVTAIPGVETVNNPSGPITIGTSPESDSDFRRRMIGSRYSRTSLPGAVKSALNKIPGIIDYWFYNNGEGETVTVNNVAVNAHSIVLVIQGGDDQAIAEALFNTRSAGCGFTAIPLQSTTVNIDDTVGAFSMSYPVTFNRPKAVEIDVAIQLKRGSFAGTDAVLTDAVEEALEAWTRGEIVNVDRPRIGATIYTYEIGAAISDAIPEIVVQQVKICATGDTPASSPIATSGNELVTLKDITVTINS